MKKRILAGLMVTALVAVAAIIFWTRGSSSATVQDASSAQVAPGSQSTEALDKTGHQLEKVDPDEELPGDPFSD